MHEKVGEASTEGGVDGRSQWVGGALEKEEP